MNPSRTIVFTGALLVLLLIAGNAWRTREQSPDLARERVLAWGEAATQACWTIQNRISAYGWDHWEPLNEADQPLARVAARRRQIVEFQEDALRLLRSRGPAPPGAPTEALRRFERTLAATRDVIRTAERGDTAAYVQADLRMRHSILATRAAFERAGAENVCNFAI